MQRAAAVFQADIKQRENFNRLTALTDFETRENTRLAEAQRTATGDGRDFTKAFMERHDSEAAAVLGTVTDPTERAQWQQRIAQMRQTFSRGALSAEFAIRDNHYGTQLSAAQTPLLNGVLANPDQADSYRSRGVELINATGLPEPAKVQMRAAWEQSVQQARAMGHIERDPAGAAAALGGTTPYRATLRRVESAGNDRAGADTSSATGRYQFTDATWNDVANTPEGRAAGLRPIGTGQARTDADPRYDVDQQEKAVAILTVRNQKTLEAAGIAANSRNTYLAHFLGAQGAIDFIRAMDRAPNGTAADVNEAAATANKRHFYRPDGSARTLAEAYQSITGPFANAGNPGAEPSQDYSAIPFQQTAALRECAEREATRRQIEGDALMAQQQSQRVDELMTRILEGKAGRADVVAMRDRGELQDFNSYKRALDLATSKENESRYLNAFNARVAQGDGAGAWNPFDSEQRKMVEAAVEARVATGIGRGQAAFEVWQQTGILAKAGSEALRGAFLSTYPARLKAAYNMAVSMLRSNPNAFAGVEGSAEILQQAAIFDTMVNQRGKTADEAVQLIAQQNRPESQETRRVRDEDAKRFRDELMKRDHSSTIRSILDTNGWLPGGRGEMPIGATARAALLSDYVDAAQEHYQRFGDRAAAVTFAGNEIKRMYGVSNGRIMRFPPERSYPAVMDADGNASHAYIYSQAAEAVRQVTGRAVKPEDVSLVPLPYGATSEAWRAGRPAPYAVWYRFMDPTGAQRFEPIYLPASMNHRPWVADPAAAAAAATAAREEKFRARQAGERPVTAADAPAGVLRAGQDPEEWARQTNERRGQIRGAAEFFGADPMAAAAQANPNRGRAPAPQPPDSRTSRDFPPAPGEVRPGFRNPK